MNKKRLDIRRGLQDRTKAHLKGVELKKRGYKVTRVLDEFDELVILGYSTGEKAKKLADRDYRLNSNLTLVGKNTPLEEVFDFVFYN